NRASQVSAIVATVSVLASIGRSHARLRRNSRLRPKLAYSPQLRRLETRRVHCGREVCFHQSNVRFEGQSGLGADAHGDFISGDMEFTSPRMTSEQRWA